MKLSDLVCSRDGSLSMPKLAGATGHFLFAVAFFKLQILPEKPVFIMELWLSYGTLCIGHAFGDKTVASVKSVREKWADVKASAQPAEPSP